MADAPVLESSMITFLDAHQAAIVGLLDQAYEAAGGHYAAMSPPQRRRQAAADSRTFISDFLYGDIDRESVEETVAHATIAVDDILRMVEALDRLFTAFVREQLADQPALAAALVARSTALNASFRTNLQDARADHTAPRFGPGTPS
jgi:hypothetical protein